MPSHVAICWCPEADIIRELEWYTCCRIYAAVKQGLSLTELSPCHAVLMLSQTVYWFERGGFLVLTGMPRPVLGQSCTTSIKDFAIFPPHQKKSLRSYYMG